MRAFHGDPKVKATYLARVRAHQKADEIIHGTYWERGKGCAVGCTIHSGKHASYETELGIPLMLAHLEDRLFEGMPNAESKKFPARFLNAISPGADLSRVGWQFLHWLLTEELHGRDDPRVAKEIAACAQVLVPLMEGRALTDREREHAAEVARCTRSVADAAYAANAAAAADAAYAADAADDAADAYAANAYAANAAAAADAADAAAADAYAAYAAYAANAAAYAFAAVTAPADARRQCYVRMAEKLIELLKSAPIPQEKAA